MLSLTEKKQILAAVKEIKANWFKDLTDEEKKVYVEKHPNSQYAKSPEGKTFEEGEEVDELSKKEKKIGILKKKIRMRKKDNERLAEKYKKASSRKAKAKISQQEYENENSIVRLTERLDVYLYD